MTVTLDSTPLIQDKLGRFCPGRRYTVRFDTDTGNLPQLEVEHGNLTGDGLQVTVVEVGTS